VRNRLSSERQQWLVAQRLRRLRPDLLHVHFGTDAVHAEHIAVTLDIPMIVTCHGYDVTALRDRSAYRAQLRGLFERVDLVVAVSDFIRDRVIALGADPARVVRHYTGVPISPTPPSVDDRRGVVFIGRLVEKKGIADLLAAYGRLDVSIRAQHPLTVIGSGDLEAELHALNERGRLGARFTGAITSSEVARHLDGAAVVCVPSRTAASGDSEGLPTVILEAGAHGVPVIASRHAGNAEAIDDETTGLLFDEGDDGGLQQCLRNLLTDDALLRKMGAAAHLRVASDFDIDRQTARLESLYDGLLPR
jgi:glycosyltransferase involved in cell wall biosynthesis